MSQEIKLIAVKDLVLWTENPRDPIDPGNKDQDIVDRAFEDKLSKWTLAKLVREMGPDYDFSEIPTVVYQRSKPIVYDGNRRIILAKLKHGYVTVPDSEKLALPDIPKRANIGTRRLNVSVKVIDAEPSRKLVGDYTHSGKHR